jgi:hypothetical protein
VQLKSLERQRGQTMPFWVVGILIVLTLLFFVANYGASIVWQIRAQNAADSAASTALTIQANLWNEENTILYSASLDEYRMRAINQAILNTINNGAGGGCGGATCDNDYKSLVAEYNAALSGYNADIQLLRQGNNFTEGAQQADVKKAQAHIGSNCVAGDYMCSFSYTALDVSNGNGQGNGKSLPTESDYVACKNVSYIAPLLFKLSNNASYKAIGRGAAAIVPVQTEAFVPGTAINPSTGAVYQPTETQWASGYSAPAYWVDFSGLTVNLRWYAAATIRPYMGNLTAADYTCS